MRITNSVSISDLYDDLYDFHLYFVWKIAERKVRTKKIKEKRKEEERKRNEGKKSEEESKAKGREE